MKIFQPFTYVLLIAILTLSSCGKDKKGDLSLKIESLYNGTVINDFSDLQNAVGQSYDLQKAEFYFSNIATTNEAGETVHLADAILYGLLDGGSYTVQVPEGKYTNLTLGIGLDEAMNGTDPSTIKDLDSPLHPRNANYWSWSTKYVFLKLEGKVGATADAQEEFFLYHIGKDGIYQDKVLSRDFDIVKEETTEVTIQLHLDKLFQMDGKTLDMVTENVTHTNDYPEVADLVWDSFVNSVE